MQHPPPPCLSSRSVAIFIGPPVGAMLPPLTAALGALGTVVGCALYTLLVLPESLTPEAKAMVRLGKGQQHTRASTAVGCDCQAQRQACLVAGRTSNIVGWRSCRLLATHPQAQRRHREQQHSQRQGGGRAMHPALGSTLRAVRILMRSPLFKRLTVTMMITGKQLLQASNGRHTAPSSERWKF